MYGTDGSSKSRGEKYDSSETIKTIGYCKTVENNNSKTRNDKGIRRKYQRNGISGTSIRNLTASNCRGGRKGSGRRIHGSYFTRRRSHGSEFFCASISSGRSKGGRYCCDCKSKIFAKYYCDIKNDYRAGSYTIRRTNPNFGRYASVDI